MLGYDKCLNGFKSWQSSVETFQNLDENMWGIVVKSGACQKKKMEEKKCIFPTVWSFVPKFCFLAPHFYVYTKAHSQVNVTERCRLMTWSTSIFSFQGLWSYRKKLPNFGGHFPTYFTSADSKQPSPASITNISTSISIRHRWVFFFIESKANISFPIMPITPHAQTLTSAWIHRAVTHIMYTISLNHPTEILFQTDLKTFQILYLFVPKGTQKAQSDETHPRHPPRPSRWDQAQEGHLITNFDLSILKINLLR